MRLQQMQAIFVCIVICYIVSVTELLLWLQTNATTADASLCSKAQDLKEANVPLQLVSGWLDSTASAAINLFHHCGQAPG